MRTCSRVRRCGACLVSLILKHFFTVTGTAPWIVRIDEIKSATAVNVEAERKVAQLNDEMQALVRTLKSKDQHIQEAGVKIELMERRMETVKKQADAIVDLETELQKARKQEKAYEDAMEQLQTDLDAFEQENSKLKQAAASAEKQGMFLLRCPSCAVIDFCFSANGCTNRGARKCTD